MRSINLVNKCHKNVDRNLSYEVSDSFGSDNVLTDEFQKVDVMSDLGLLSVVPFLFTGNIYDRTLVRKILRQWIN